MTNFAKIDFTTFNNFTPPMLRQIKRQLLKNLHESNTTWASYHTNMRTVLGLRDNENCLHERDPRNWIIDRRKPTIAKLRLYARFIQSTYPDFEFSDTETEDHISIGMALGRFSVGEAEIGSRTLTKNAARLDGSFFVSNSYHRKGLDSEQTLLNLITVRAVPETPFLVVFRFSLEMSRYGTQETEKVAVLMDRDFSVNEDGIPPILNLQKGILAPLANGRDYHGMLQSADYCPEYIILKKSKLSDSFMFEGLSPENKGADTHTYHLTPRLPHFHQMVNELGDIIL